MFKQPLFGFFINFNILVTSVSEKLNRFENLQNKKRYSIIRFYRENKTLQ